jgi:nitroimidazol reductase NimA-like FMN-containing flavoprotein (pyridoxamine 5'-phosphate oxidase superfamily)
MGVVVVSMWSRVPVGCDSFGAVHETESDLAELQQILDTSHRAAGAHLRSIFHDERRLSATGVVELMTGVQILSLATVTADGRPLVGPVDGLFYRGHFYFGSSPDSVRFHHIRTRGHVSAAHVRGEELAVIVHGTAEEINTSGTSQVGFRNYLIEVYGDEWTEWGPDSPYARIDPRRMYAAYMPTVDIDPTK